MIPFTRLTWADKRRYEQILFDSPERGCEYSFANINLWGKQQVAFLHDCVAFFSHFGGRSIYPYPIGNGDRRAVVEAILRDAGKRGIPCRFTGLTQTDARELEDWFPGRFHIRPVRDSYDYVYAIDDLADLKGRKFQKKRNHFNRFRTEHPDYQVLRINECNLPLISHMINDWFMARMRQDPEGDYMLENIALARATRNYVGLGLEGIALVEDGRVLAMTMGSRMSPDTMDVHFEKAREDVDGAYNAVNCEFARHLRLRMPEIKYLNREDDMGLEGLRKAKLSYNPHHMVEKYWAILREDIDDDWLSEA